MITKFIVGPFLTNCYVVNCDDTREAAIIDPGVDRSHETEKIVNFVRENFLKPKLVLNTHGHPDHTCGNGVIKRKFNVPIAIHEEDTHLIGEAGRKIAGAFGFANYSPEPDVLLHDGDLVNFGKVSLKVIHTPGHSRGSISLVSNDEIFTGDTLFEGSIGRIDFPESSEQDMAESLRKLMKLPEHFRAYPGHGSETTIGNEKHSNSIMRIFIERF